MVKRRQYPWLGEKKICRKKKLVSFGTNDVGDQDPEEGEDPSHSARTLNYV